MASSSSAEAGGWKLIKVRPTVNGGHVARFARLRYFARDSTRWNQNGILGWSLGPLGEKRRESPGCAASIEMACPRSVCFLFSISLMLEVLLVVNNNEGRDRFYFSRHCIVQIDIDGDSIGDLRVHRLLLMHKFFTPGGHFVCTSAGTRINTKSARGPRCGS